jgi:hypothetical protein
MGKNYEERFDDVMKYVKIRVEGQGSKIKVRDKQDLRQIFERLDASRTDKSGSPRMSKNFIDKLLQTRRADAMIGHNVGRFGKEKELKREEKYRSQGRHVYSYPRGRAVKSTYAYRNKTFVRFRDVQTGRFVRSAEVSED